MAIDRSVPVLTDQISRVSSMAIKYSFTAFLSEFERSGHRRGYLQPRLHGDNWQKIWSRDKEGTTVSAEQFTGFTRLENINIASTKICLLNIVCGRFFCVYGSVYK